MLLLAKAALAMMLGFGLSIIAGLIIIPLLKKYKIGQQVSRTVGERHMAKQGTPTMGGLIFIIPTLLAMLFLYLRGSISYSHNMLILIFVFISYAILGGIDDVLKVKFKNNKGLSISTKFLLQMVIALVFFYIFMKNGGEPTLAISFLHLEIPMGWTFGLFILFLLVGSIIGFLVFNTHPARVFMGDLGSLALGGALATIAVITRHEISLALIGGIFVIETLSSLIQIIAITKFHKRIFLKAPLHHHFEALGWNETDIVKMFWTIGLLLAMAAITYGVWL